jgi:F0F1-type ATP synthase assembly protein I
MSGDKPRGGPSGSAPWGIAFSVILGLGGGLVVDNWLGTLPIFTLIGVVLGIGAAMYTIWDVARKAMRR